MASLVLVASDLPSLRRSVAASIESPDLRIVEAATGREAVQLASDEDVDLAILDLQIASMGAIAICVELHNLESAGLLPHVPVIVLLDRRPDVFLARRSNAEGFLIKPLSPVKLRRAVRAVLDGDTYEDDAWRPVTVRSTPADA